MHGAGRAFVRTDLSRVETAVSGKSFDSDNSGGIEFDEFIQMTAEWLETGVLPKSRRRYWLLELRHEMWKLQDRFSTTIAAEECGYSGGRDRPPHRTSAHLQHPRLSQMLGSVQVIYQAIVAKSAQIPVCSPCFF